MLRRWITLLMIAMLAVKAAAQSGTVYPIDLSVMMTPPYGTCLKEYVGSERITVQALLKDFSKSSTQFVLQLKVTDNRNKTVLMTHFGGYDFKPGQLFTYPMGGPNSGETSNILHDMFANATVQPRNECFEEGAYTFTFQAYDATTYPSRKIALSPAFTVPVFLQGNTVQPLQIYPYESEVICPNATIEYKKFGMKKESTKTDMINYQWQAANPTGMRVGYHLQVVDLGEIGSRSQQEIESSAQSGFGNSSPMIVDHRTYTPFYNHAFSAGNYVEKHAYAWRVRALTGTDLETESSFADRTAPVRVFYICGFPEEVVEEHDDKLDERVFDKKLDRVKMDTVDSSSLNATAFWVDNVEVKRKYCGVSVEIRKKGQEKWTPYFVEMNEDTDSEGNALDNYYHFSNLNYNTRYEVRAQYVKCEGGSCAERTDKSCTYAPYSDTIGFVVPSLIDSAKCGDDLPKLTDCAGAGAPEVSAGDTIMANGMPVVLDSVHYEGDVSKGVISGRGHICFPIIKNIQMKMKFEKITINCAKELAKGEVVSVYDEQTCAMIDIDNLTGERSAGAKDNPSGEAKTTPYTEENVKNGKPGDLFVKNDEVYMKTKDGKTEKIGKLVTFTSGEYEDRGSDMKKNEFHFVEFFNEDKVNNAFDNDEQNYALKVHDKDFEPYAGGALVMPWLANNPGKMKTVKARELKKKGGEEHDDYESVLFIIPSATDGGYIQLDAEKDASGNYELHIPGWSDIHSSTPVTAIARTSATEPYLNAGRMMVGNYKERTHKLNIVSLVGKLDDSYKTEAEKALNSIYGRVGVTYEVTLSVFDNDSIKRTILNDGLSIGADKESRWKVETKEMRAIRSLYSDSVEIDKNAAYLFVVNHPEEEEYWNSVDGDMPRNQSVGYLFKDNINDGKLGRLVAHELGHGVYKFQHLFDYKDIKEGSTDNLMDYNNGDFLAHFQWKIMQDSAMFVWKVLQDDEDAMAKQLVKDAHYIVTDAAAIERKSNGNPKKDANGKNITIDKGTEVIALNGGGGNKKIKIVASSEETYTSATYLTIINKKERLYYFHTTKALDLFDLPYIKNSENSTKECVKGSHIKVLADLSYKVLDKKTGIPTTNDYFVCVDKPNADNYTGEWLTITDYAKEVCDLPAGDKRKVGSNNLTASDFVTTPYGSEQYTGTLDLSKFTSGKEINVIASCGKYYLISGTKQDDNYKGAWVSRDVLEFCITMNDLLSIVDNPVNVNQNLVNIINKYCNEYDINTVQKMSYFIGQCVAENNLGIKREGIYTKPRRIVKMFSDKSTVGHIFNKAVFNTETYTYSYEAITFKTNTCTNFKSDDWTYTTQNSIIDAYASIKDLEQEVTLADGSKKKYKVYRSRNRNSDNLEKGGVVGEFYNDGILQVKDEYINSESLFDVVYACKYNNGNISSQDGRIYRGRGYIQLTWKSNYNTHFYIPYKADHPNDNRSISELAVLVGTDADIAMQASMSFFKSSTTTNSKFKGTNAIDFTSEITDDDDNIRKISIGINGGGTDKKMDKIEGHKKRTYYSVESYKVLK